MADQEHEEHTEFADLVEVNIKSIIGDDNLRPYFLDLVAKNILRSLYQACQDRYPPRIKAQKEFYESLYSLTERLKYMMPEYHIKDTIYKVSKHYYEVLTPIIRKERFDVFN